MEQESGIGATPPQEDDSIFMPEELAANTVPVSRGLIVSAFDLQDQYPNLRPHVIDSLLRRGEVMNLVSASKQGKTFLAIDLAMSVAVGAPWIETYETAQGAVLYIDNELHAETISDRLREIGDKRGITREEYRDSFDYMVLRGAVRSLDVLRHDIANACKSREYRLICIDALYRTYPDRLDENDNAAMTRFYNQIDVIAGEHDSGMVLVHHTTKGTQSGKMIMEVGRGAGASGGAVDSHIVLRPHKDPKAAVLDGRVRSWLPVTPRCYRFEYPIWVRADDLNPEDLEGTRASSNGYASSSNGNTYKKSGPPTASDEEVADCLTDKWETWKQIYSRANERKLILGQNRTQEVLAKLVKDGVAEVSSGKRMAKKYRRAGLNLSPEEPEVDIT